MNIRSHLTQRATITRGTLDSATGQLSWSEVYSKISCFVALEKFASDESQVRDDTAKRRAVLITGPSTDIRPDDRVAVVGIRPSRFIVLAASGVQFDFRGSADHYEFQLIEAP
ncbi:hypothetical protein [Allobranchiibius sp. CTAmp26]|uniref:hypothetical protein n=1 Tax=Allobranchiibius sp. CTAmp26 TaxID=2815214 RepID=UPI001AA0DA02|nr:hypothetical protein [Allobranchiibius sp. CTAmp26]MBO1755702.1 hypothetical protein [Allobranchiibius sp. CTAmp26]